MCAGEGKERPRYEEVAVGACPGVPAHYRLLRVSHVMAEGARD